jgi:hypothetical protein
LPQGGPRPCEVNPRYKDTVDPHFVLTNRQLDAGFPQKPLHERLEHALCRSGIRISQSQDLPEHPSPPASTGTESIEPGTKADEQFGVPAEGRLHGRLHNAPVRYRSQVDELPDETGDPEWPQEAAVGPSEFRGPVQGEALGHIGSAARSGELHQARLYTFELPQRRSCPVRDSSLRPGPQRRCHEALLQAYRGSPHPVDGWEHTLPLPFPEAVLDVGSGESCLEGL